MKSPNLKLIIIYVSFFLLLIFSCTSTSRAQNKINLKVEKIQKLENNFDKGEGNSYYLKDMPDGYPIIGLSCSKNFQDCTVGFYDANFNLVAGYREPNYPGDKIMNIFSDDLDMDGEPEILMSVRMEKPGMVCLNWDPVKKQLREKWLFTLEGKNNGPYCRGSIAGNFTDSPGKEVCLGNNRGILYLLTSEGKLITAADLPNTNAIQRMCTCDIDGDGYNEMIISSGRNPGRVTYCKWNRETLKLEIIWQTDVTPNGKGGVNCFEAIFHPNGHPDGGPAIGAVTEMEGKDGNGKRVLAGSFLLLDMKGNIVWQKVLDPGEGRSGGCDFKDVTGDGIPEILGRFSDYSEEGTGILIYSNKGERLGKYPRVTASSAGPSVFYLTQNSEKNTYFVATNTVYQILNEKQTK